MNMKGRCALVTGASGALGRVIAETIAEMGGDLILVDLDQRALDQGVVDLCQKWKVSIHAIACDLEHQEDRDRLIASVQSAASRLDILVNNAAFVGTSSLSGWAVPFEQQSVETWRRATEVNLTAPFDLCKQLLPLLKGSPAASIINIGSIYGMYGPDWSLYEGTMMANPAAYASSKGGLLQLTRWLATTLAPDVRVNSICPGGISRDQPREFVNRYQARTPLGRMATEDDFRGAVAYLASDLSKYVTGQNLSVDGGWGAW